VKGGLIASWMVLKLMNEMIYLIYFGGGFVIFCWCLVPNACCSVAVPVDIFDFDVTPKDGGPVKANRGNVAVIMPK